MRRGLWYTLKHLYARPTNKEPTMSTALLQLPKHGYKVYIDDNWAQIAYHPGPRITAWLNIQMIEIVYKYETFSLYYEQKHGYRTDSAVISHDVNGFQAETSHKVVYKFE